MDKAEAFRTLRLDQSADGRMVENAYWTLVRRAQADDDPAAAAEIDQLNQAYGVLSPDAMNYAAAQGAGAMRAPVQGSSGVGLLDSAADWVNDEAQRVRRRWDGRNPEVGVIGGVTIFLMLLALTAGAPSLLVLISVLVIALVIWAPWRRAT
jgi:hypothetical protein